MTSDPAPFRPLRLPPGADLRREIERRVAAWPRPSAFVVAGLGSLSRAELRYAGVAEPTRIEEPLELLSLSGTVTAQGAHLHAAVATASGRVLGGHVGPGCIVRTTAELLLAALPGWSLARAHDAATGYAELVVVRDAALETDNRPMNLAIEHRDEPSGGAFFIRRTAGEAGDPLAEMIYRRADARTIVVEHTEVDPAASGQGIGRRLLDALVAWARRQSVRVVPQCPYVRAQFEKDAALRDVLA